MAGMALVHWAVCSPLMPDPPPLPFGQHLAYPMLHEERSSAINGRRRILGRAMMLILDRFCSVASLGEGPGIAESREVDVIASAAIGPLHDPPGSPSLSVSPLPLEEKAPEAAGESRQGQKADEKLG